MITVTQAPAPQPAEPKEGDAFEFSFAQGRPYTCLVIESNRVVVIKSCTPSGRPVGRLVTLGETWNSPAILRGRIYTKVTIHLEP